LRVVYSDPDSSGYTGGADRPAEFEELITVLPADWKAAGAVWITIHGLSWVEVDLDTSNNLKLRWRRTGGMGGGEWVDKLPPGYWRILHPVPRAAWSGEVVLLLRSGMQLAPPEGRGLT
jgi:hypothetical protein